MDFFKWNFNISFWWISSLSFYLRIHWRLSAILKTSNKSIWNDAFWYHKAYIFWKFSLYTIHWDKTTVNKNFLWTKCYKKCTLFPFRSSNLPQFYHSWSMRFISSHVYVGFSIFNSTSFLLKFIFLCNKKHGLFDFKTFLSKLK